MPNITIQVSNNIQIANPDVLLAEINRVLWESNEFGKPEDIKSRIVSLSNSLVGLEDDRDEHGFICVNLKIMAGRSYEVKNRLAEDIALIIRQTLVLDEVSKHIHTQLCIEVEEIGLTYLKSIL